MKKCFAIFLVLCLVFSLSGCTSGGSSSSTASSRSTSGGEMATGHSFDSLQTIMGDTSFYNWEDVLIVIGRIAEEPFSVRQFGDVRTVEVDQTIYGELPEEVNLLQMYEFQLDTSRTYLLMLQPQSSEVYNVIGFGEQAAFWIEDGELCGNDPDLVEEIRNDTAAKTYAANGETPDVNTMDGLADYFAARVAALE